MSRFGRWVIRDGLPAFQYELDHWADPAAEWDPIVEPLTRRHWVGVGNRRIQLFVDNEGGAALFDEFDGLRWITAPEPGTGTSVIHIEGESSWGSAFHLRPAGVVPIRTFGPTWFEVSIARNGLSVQRTILCPEGEHPWVLVAVDLGWNGDDVMQLRHVEEWALRPRYLQVWGKSDARREVAERAVRYNVEFTDGGLRALGTHDLDKAGVDDEGRPLLFGKPASVVLEALGETPFQSNHEGDPHPVLALATDVELEPGTEQTLWFRFGLDSPLPTIDPHQLMDSSKRALKERLPRAASKNVPSLEREIPWHAAVLTGGACVDGVLGGHTLNQGSAYCYCVGLNGGARDPVQHALPLVYTEPDLALLVLRNTLAWSHPDGELPWGLDGAKQPWTSMFDPSDMALWSLWLAAEYLAATGDENSFNLSLPFHPAHGAESAPLIEHLRRQWRYLTTRVGFGPNGHFRIRNSDWNDLAVHDAGVPLEVMVEGGESVLNSAMGSWVLGVWAGACERLGDSSLAADARLLSDRLRQLVASEWNGKWFRRAHAPGAGPVGDKDLWLEVQPWSILCGAADAERSRMLLKTIDQLLRADSPLGCRIHWPTRSSMGVGDPPGEGHNGGVWFPPNMALVWASSKFDPDMAWDELARMTLAAHTNAYPDIWEGTLSGSDSYNAPESKRAGRTSTWPELGFAAQAFPVNNLHSHSQPVLAYLRALGVEPGSDGKLRVGGGGIFSSRTFSLNEDGSGRLAAAGRVTVVARQGEFAGGPGELHWPLG